jgi:hypothetical protein
LEEKFYKFTSNVKTAQQTQSIITSMTPNLWKRKISMIAECLNQLHHAHFTNVISPTFKFEMCSIFRIAQAHTQSAKTICIRRPEHYHVSTVQQILYHHSHGKQYKLFIIKMYLTILSQYWQIQNIKMKRVDSIFVGEANCHKIATLNLSS